MELKSGLFPKKSLNFRHLKLVAPATSHSNTSFQLKLHARSIVVPRCNYNMLAYLPELAMQCEDSDLFRFASVNGA